MKIAIIGTTPIMIIHALLQSKKHDVTIFERSNKLGGAWAYGFYKNIVFSEKTNVVVPTNIIQEKYIPKMINFLKKKFKINIKKNLKFYKHFSRYKPKNIFHFRFDKLFKTLKNSKIKIKHSWVKSFIVNKKKVLINGSEFDKIYLPYYCGIKSAKIDKKKYYFPYTKNINCHLQIIVKRKFMNEIYFSKHFDPTFDRVQFLKKKKYFFFTGRVNKKYKKHSKKQILKVSRLNFESRDLLRMQLIKYTYFYRKTNQIKKLLKLKNCESVKIVDTRQFVQSFMKSGFVK